MGALSFGALLACGGVLGGGSRAFDGPHQATIQGLAVSPDGRLLVTAAEDRSARAWRLPELEGLRVLPHEGFVGTAAFAPDGARVATGGVDGVRVWSTQDWEPVGFIDLPAYALAWSPDGLLAVAPRDDGAVALYDASLRPVRTLAGHAEPVGALAFSRDGARLVTGSKDRTARLWDARTGDSLRVFVAHRAEVIAVALSQDDERLVTASVDKTARLWEVSSGEPVRLLAGHTDWVTAVDLRDGDQVLATAGRDGVLRLWDTRSGGTIVKMDLELGPLEAMRFADPDTLVAAGAEVFVRGVGELLVDHTPGPVHRVRDLDPQCAALVRCGVALAVAGGDRGARGVEIARSARELDVQDPKACTAALAEVGPELGAESVPPACAP